MNDIKSGNSRLLRWLKAAKVLMFIRFLRRFNSKIRSGLIYPSRLNRFELSTVTRSMNKSNRFSQVANLVQRTYTTSQQAIAPWMWINHVQLVTRYAEQLSERFAAKTDLAVAGALLHDFGDAFVSRHAPEHEEVTRRQATQILQQANYSATEIDTVLTKIIAPHSCYLGNLPTTLEGQVLATADAMAHLTTDFYLQFAWKNLPDGKTYPEFLAWVQAKLDRDFNDKIFFAEIRDEVKERYLALKLVFAKK